MIENIESAVSLIDEINHRFYAESGLTPVSLITDGDAMCIQIFDYPLWDSENDERKWDEDKDEPEPLEEYLRRELNLFLDNLLEVRL